MSAIRRHAAPLLVTAVAAGIVLAGCTLTAAPEEIATRAEPDSPPPQVAEPSPEPTEPSSPVPPASGDPSDEQTARDCDDADRTELTAAVDGQLDAIVGRDWEQALAFATDGFRADIGPDQFRDIILDGFPVVADTRARDVGRCRVGDAQATLEVTVEDRDGTRQPLLYLFEHDGERWGIGGAVPPSDGSGSDDQPTIEA